MSLPRQPLVHHSPTSDTFLEGRKSSLVSFLPQNPLAKPRLTLLALLVSLVVSLGLDPGGSWLVLWFTPSKPKGEPKPWSVFEAKVLLLSGCLLSIPAPAV